MSWSRASRDQSPAFRDITPGIRGREADGTSCSGRTVSVRPLPWASALAGQAQPDRSIKVAAGMATAFN